MTKHFGPLDTTASEDAKADNTRNSSMPKPIRTSIRSWASTLCLPKSTFPPRPLLADRPRFLKACTDDLYAQQRLRKGVQDCGPTLTAFVVHDGPPYANGSLHVGHALNKILKDITNRFQVSLGNAVDYKPGWDCHGLPIELKALQNPDEFGAVNENRKPNAVQIRNAARKLAAGAVEEQMKGFREWGIMADWDNAWTTMDQEYELNQLEVFKKMVSKGLIHRRFKPVYWSPSSQTALAEAELEYKQDHISTAVFIRFPLVHVGSGLKEKVNIDWKDVSALIWTTTPWTLPANRAIAVHSDLEYVIVNSSQHGLMLLAKCRVEETERLCQVSFTRIQHPSIRGSDLSGALYRHPGWDDHSSPSPILHADFVSADSGSGMVHSSPNHGMDDYKLCQQHGIDVSSGVDDEGCFTDMAWPSDPQALAGKPVLSSGNTTVLQLLAERGAVVATHQYVHKYPYDWRSKEPVIVRATEQWFADVGEIREAALRSLEAVRFIPEGGKERLSSFLHHRSEWCISRQRAWGVPIPALYHHQTGKAVLHDESISHIISLIQERGTDAWWTDDDLDPAWTPPGLREESGQTLYRRGKDTMDVWFDSGTSWTQIAATSNELGTKRVADMYLEGSDQHRGWFQSSLLTSIAFQLSTKRSETHFSAPYKTLITHGFTLDQNGRKMSKSEGNVISPSQIMDGTLLPPIKQKNMKRQMSAEQSAPRYDALGPDSLRLWAAGCDYTRDVVVGQSVLQAIQNSLLKFRVTFKLLIGLLCSTKQEPLLQFSKFGTVDQMALIQLRRLEQQVRGYYEEHEYHRVVAALNQYVNSSFSAFYMESIKDRVYADAMNSESRNQAVMILWQIYKRLSSMLAPITPLLVEEARWYMAENSHDVHQQVDTSWTDPFDEIHRCFDMQDEIQLEKDMQYLQVANAAVKAAQESARAAKKIGSSLESCVYLGIEDDAQEPVNHTLTAKSLLEPYIQGLEDLFVVSKVEIGEGPAPSDISTANWVYSSSFAMLGQKIVTHVYAPQDDKCVRCWKYTVPLGSDLEEILCLRCVGVLEGMREEIPNVFQDCPHLDAAALACRHGFQRDMYQRHWDL